MSLCPRGCGRHSRKLLVRRSQPVLCRECHLARDLDREGWTALHAGEIDRRFAAARAEQKRRRAA